MKYKLTDNTIKMGDKTLYQIEALKDFSFVKKLNPLLPPIKEVKALKGVSDENNREMVSRKESMC